MFNNKDTNLFNTEKDIEEENENNINLLQEIYIYMQLLLHIYARNNKKQLITQNLECYSIYIIFYIF